MLRDRFLRWVGRATHRYWWLVLIVVAITIVFCGIAISSLRITTGYIDLLPQDHKAVKDYFKVLEQFGGTDYVFLVVDSKSAGEMRAAVDQAAGLMDDSGDFNFLQYRADTEQFMRYGLLYLDAETLKKIDLLLSERKFDELTALALKFASLRDDLSSSFGIGVKVDEEGYFSGKDGTTGLVTGRPSFGSSDVDAVTRLGRDMQALKEAVEAENPGTKVWIGGSYEFEYEQRAILGKDMLIVGAIALGLIILILAIAFRSVITPLAAMIALSCGVIWTLGLARITVRTLNTVSAIFAIVLMGIGIEYGIALLSRYREERGRGCDSEQGFVNALANTGKGVITGALTTAAAFFALAFSDFKAMHDMGLVLGMGVICALLSMLFVLPAMMALKERLFPTKGEPDLPKAVVMRKLGGFVSRRAVLVVIIGILVTAGLGTSAGFIKYESNIRKVQPRAMDVNKAEDRLAKEFGIVSDFAVVLASNEAAMREVTEDLKELDSVQAVESMATIIPPDQLAKLVYMSRIKSKIENINPEWLSYVPAGMLTILESVGSDLLTADKLPGDVRAKYVADDGTYAVYVYPKKTMDEEANVKEFLGEVEKVSTEIVGFPAIIEDLMQSTRRGLSETTLLSAIAVALVVIIDFQALVPTLLALLPLLLSLAWMMGLVSMVGMKFNLVNIAATPIILGIGVDFGVYILHRYMEEHAEEGDTIPSVLAHTGMAIVVSGLTVIAAFAALMFARYQGLGSLGMVASIGIAFAALTAVTILPAILRLLEKYRKKGRAF